MVEDARVDLQEWPFCKNEAKKYLLMNHLKIASRNESQIRKDLECHHQQSSAYLEASNP
jgi:hypothetical protein